MFPLISRLKSGAQLVLWFFLGLVLFFPEPARAQDDDMADGSVVLLAREKLTDIEEDAPSPFFFYSKVFDNPPYWIKKEGDAEWQLWIFNRGSRSEGSHGRLYIGDQEVLGHKKDEKMTCSLGEFVWRGGYEARVRNWDDSGWQPVDREKFMREIPSASPFLPDHQAYGSSRSGELEYLYWRTNPDRLPQGYYGALKIDGRWIFGQALGEHFKADASPFFGEYVWHGDLRQPGLNLGWLEARDDPRDLYDPPKWFVNKKPHLILTSGETEWRAWFMELRYKCPVCADYQAYGELRVNGRDLIGTKRGQTHPSGLGLFAWTPESGWLPEDKSLYIDPACGREQSWTGQSCPGLKPGVPSVMSWEGLEDN